MTVSPLVQALLDVPGVVAELEAETPRLTLTANYGERTSSGSKTAPAPVNIDAVSAKHELHTWLVSKAIQLGKPFNRAPGELASHLIRNMEHIEANGWADTWAGELREQLNQCERAILQAEHRKHIGPCNTIGCLTQLSARETDTQTTCRHCGHAYNIAGYLEARIADALNTETPLRAAQAVRYLNSHGIQVTTKDIENWLQWGHITPVSFDDKGRREYNIKDIYKRAARKAA